MPHAQLMPYSDGAAVRGSRLTDVAGMLESYPLTQVYLRTGREIKEMGITSMFS